MTPRELDICLRCGVFGNVPEDTAEVNPVLLCICDRVEISVSFAIPPLPEHLRSRKCLEIGVAIFQLSRDVAPVIMQINILVDEIYMVFRLTVYKLAVFVERQCVRHLAAIRRYLQLEITIRVVRCAILLQDLAGV